MTGRGSVRTVRLAVDERDRQAAYAVRFDVFVTEQQVPADLELDDLDDVADHFVAYDGDRPVGAGRLVVEPAGFEGADPALGPVGHLGRLAVRPETRGSALGVALVRAIEGGPPSAGCGWSRSRPRPTRWASTSASATRPTATVFDDAGLPHRWMTRPLG